MASNQIMLRCSAVLRCTALWHFGVLWIALFLMPESIAAAEQVRPHVLFIALDDLNDWIGVLGGHPQTITPNLDRLAASSVVFTNAHCAAPACNPSRTAIFTGISPHHSGIYSNAQKMREVLPDVELLPKTLSRHGYYSTGSGKMLHYVIDAPSWDSYYPAAETENPFPRTFLPKDRPVNLPVGGPWQYVDTDWGALDVTDEQGGGDYLVTDYIIEQLAESHEDKPVFLACGIYRPHEPWFVPQKYFEPFPLDSIQLPPGYREEDLNDVPETGQRLARNRYFPHILREGKWKEGIQAYLASIHYADAMVGRVLDALDNSEHADNTIVVLWSDHGWHLGEKEHWQKYTGWRASTRVPLMIRVPEGVPGIPAGTQPGKCGRPVNLLSLAPTLLELCGLPSEAQHDGPSLVPLLKEPQADWPHVSVTYLHVPESYGLSAERWRLVHYQDGTEELYDIQTDPYEWTNLIEDGQYAEQREQLRALAPKQFAPGPRPSVASLPSLKWNPLLQENVPASAPDGNTLDVVFINQTEAVVKLWSVNQQGIPLLTSEIQPSQEYRQPTRPGEVWLITDRDDRGVGYFRVGDRSARAVVPANK
ncbi:MAG: sulfatase-like hydrolase/transferase [Planctomycetaceae bacterium]